ncbi:hypothetical protein J6590_045778 [Homalodisca vitripennis]|nr:hypothetical protein J6590_045778 [Homalodisca vitripennis]
MASAQALRTTALLKLPSYRIHTTEVTEVHKPTPTNRQPSKKKLIFSPKPLDNVLRCVCGRYKWFLIPNPVCNPFGESGLCRTDFALTWLGLILGSLDGVRFLLNPETVELKPTQCAHKMTVYEEVAKLEPPNVGLEPTTLRLRVSCSTD